MANQFDVVCDKCGSDDIETTVKMPKYPDGKLATQKMSEYSPVMTSNLVYRYTRYHFKCRKCGYECEVCK